MSKTKWKGILIGLIVLLALGIAAYAATNYGSEDDPLITKSYLDSVVQPELEKRLQTELDEALAEVQSGSGEFTLVTLSSGQKVTGSVGTELLLRFGAADAYAYDSADVALVDTTAGASVKSGTALTANHLYMVTIAGNGFTAGQNNTKVLISGDYTIK